MAIEPLRIGTHVDVGIQAARTIVGKCYFDAESCFDGIQALRHYRYEVDEKLRGLRKEPVHDQYSHAADAFRTAAVMIREPEKKKEQERRRPWGSYPHGVKVGIQTGCCLANWFGRATIARTRLRAASTS
jgi:hypothetical protein